jgi:hypothetical protein
VGVSVGGREVGRQERGGRRTLGGGGDAAGESPECGREREPQE